MNGYLVVRAVFVLLVVYTAVAIRPIEGHAALNAALGGVVAFIIVVTEARLRDAAVTSLFGGLIGLGIGLAIASVVGRALFWVDFDSRGVRFLHGIIIIVLPYLGVVLGARKGEWLEPAKFLSLFRDVRPEKRYRVLDTSVIIDGRLADIVETGFLDGTLIVPQFVLQELQRVADSSDPIRRNRGRRGLDVLHRMQKMTGVEITISDVDFPDVRDVDMKLIELAQSLLGQIVTNDFNLNKVAQLRGIDVLNVNELANALRPVVLPGEQMTVFILKEGKEQNQGVAYLDDGTMVVVDNARNRIGGSLEIVVTSVLQTTAGRMIFGRLAEPGEGPSDRSEREDSGRRRSAAQA
ncbi:MAG TPA: PIN domain-containing protein [Vicinamibacterales bacterium]|nr:PIN domain-containing protein [Vicinamibacterales bacterium]